MNFNVGDPPQIDIQSIYSILKDIEHIESLQALMTADGCAAFFSMSEPQKADLIELTATLMLDVRCRLAAILPPHP